MSLRILGKEQIESKGAGNQEFGVRHAKFQILLDTQVEKLSGQVNIWIQISEE